MKKTLRFILLIPALFVAFSTAAAQDQSDNPDITLRLSRDFGYGGFSGDIEGLFTLHAEGPDTLEKVIFYLDGQVLIEDSESPFRYQFHTQDYELGIHTMSAVGFASDGREMRSNEIRSNFVSPKESWNTTLKIVVPLLAVIGGFTLLSFLIPWLSGRGKSLQIPLGTSRNYGIQGGTICPKCNRPFGLHVWALNLSFVGKLDRCPHCGRWSFVRKVHPDLLRAAEIAELQDANVLEQTPESTQEKLKRSLDESRYDD